MKTTIIASHGALGHEFFPIYTESAPVTDAHETVTVDIPDELIAGRNEAGQLLLNLGGTTWLLCEALTNASESPALRWYDGETTHIIELARLVPINAWTLDERPVRVEMSTLSDRHIIRDGAEVNYHDLSIDDQNRMDDLIDGLSDGPIYHDGRVWGSHPDVTSLNVWEPATLIEEGTANA